jgi:hypothetical protein
VSNLQPTKLFKVRAREVGGYGLQVRKPPAGRAIKGECYYYVRHTWSNSDTDAVERTKLVDCTLVHSIYGKQVEWIMDRKAQENNNSAIKGARLSVLKLWNNSGIANRTLFYIGKLTDWWLGIHTSIISVLGMYIDIHTSIISVLRMPTNERDADIAKVERRWSSSKLHCETGY